jgi:hypothetical protein
MAIHMDGEPRLAVRQGGRSPRTQQAGALGVRIPIRAAAPIMPLVVQTIREHCERTGVSSDSQSPSMVEP